MVDTKFREIGPRHEWLPAPQSPLPQPSETTYHKYRKQRRWLLKIHPEAVLGNAELAKVLAVENAPGSCDHGPSSHRTQLAIGEMTDTSDPRGISVVPLIATAAGHTGEVLRLLRPERSSWASEQSRILALRLSSSDVAPDETLWADHVGTIHSIKSVVDTRRSEPTRWLIVQRDSGTTVFRPEYQRVPFGSESAGVRPQEPSRIAPNLLFSLSKHQTGHRCHSDMCFNPGVKSHPPQLAIVDEGGFWTVWDIVGTRGRVYKQPRTKLNVCGSIRQGVRQKMYWKATTEPQWHRILFVGVPASAFHDLDESDDDKDTESQSASAFLPLQRSSTLLLCNQKLLRLVDLDSNMLLPDLRFTLDGSREAILDVQIDSRDPRYFFLITSSTFFVAAVFSTRDPMEDRDRKRGSILYSASHMRDRFDQGLKLFVSPGPRSSSHWSSLVFLYARDSTWIDVFCVNASKKHHERVSCSRDTISLNMSPGSDTASDLQTLCVFPALTSAQPGAKLPTQRDNLNQPIRFYQILLLDMDLKLHSTLGASSLRQPEQALLLVQSGDTPTIESLERRRIIRHLSSRFVVPDNVEDVIKIPRRLSISGPVVGRIQDQALLQRVLGKVSTKIMQTIQEQMRGDGTMSLDMDILGAAPFDPLYVAIESALRGRAFPLKIM